MPVPGPRTQHGPRPGYDNPDGVQPTLFNRWLTPHPVFYAGQTPGTKVVYLGGFVLAPGQIRRMWRQKINQISAQAPYDWVTMSPAPGRHAPSLMPVGVTRALRYMASSRYRGAGDDLSDWGAHTIVKPSAVNPTPTVGAGNTRNNPTVRNRLTSFGSRAPVLNSVVPAAQQNGSRS